jgi:hypothetical protein
MTVIWHFVIVIVIEFAMSRQFDHEKLEVYQSSIVWMLVGLIKASSDYRLHEGNSE